MKSRANDPPKSRYPTNKMLTAKTESQREQGNPRLTWWPVCLALAAISLGVFADRSQPRIRFNSDAWKSVAAGDPGKLVMVDDSLEQHELVGMKRSAIDALLGTPPQTSYFSDFDYVYWLGPERGFMSIDSEWLCIAFDNDVVVKAALTRD